MAAASGWGFAAAAAGEWAVGAAEGGDGDS